jgi:ABC-2 type transport system ATP-binding protein
VEARFIGAVPDLTGVPGVDDAATAVLDGAGVVRFALTGPPGPALAALAAAQVQAIAVREPNLEEIFLAYYGEVSR